ncbi:ABC transporter substrate-binding protein [Gordoniibacillus kamchatkensis]|uniref:ABC transporter substrate-binding protein n=1 Tax=Gordoniibacillus kamchatkensis TaxID=1590651 RepID=A0ABR5ACV5_9BACL|nr:ABC transporter substrate-binding protein [Paenibacillus sp. VKM B-2647]KIL38879.1 ABC transporter substrate-binding protein [Paenibacillus sp. VKM B-2647]
MGNAKTWAAVTLAAALIGLTGCTNANKNEGASVATTSGDDKKPITITMFSEDLNSNYENMQSPVGKKITELTGVTLKIDYPVGDPKQKIALMAASGEYPDLIFAKNDSNLIVNAGGFIDLAPLIDKYGPNIKKLYGDYLNRLRWSKDNPAIYFLGTYGVNEKQWEPKDGFMLQHQVVKELNYPKLKNLQDFENAIKTFKEKHPTINGQPTIGLTLIAEDWRIAQSVTNPAVFSTGGSDDGEWYIDDKTQKPVFHYTRPEEKEYFKWLNHMYATGLMDPESFTQKYDQYKAKIASGRVLGLIDSRWQYQEPEQALKQAGKPELTYGIYPIMLNDSLKNRNFQDAGYSAGWGIGISKSAKDPVRIIKFLDWLCSDEAQILNNWGIEGVNYKVENGKRVVTDMDLRNSDPQYGKKTGIGVYGYPFPQYGNGVKDSSGQTYTIKSEQQIMDAYTAPEKDVLSHYNAKMWQDLFPKASEFPVKPWGAAWQINIPSDTEGAVIFQKLEDIVRKRIPEMIIKSPDNFDALWDQFQREMDQAGVHKLEGQFDQLLKQRIELWNNK